VEAAWLNKNRKTQEEKRERKKIRMTKPQTRKAKKTEKETENFKSKFIMVKRY
jgi:hypothetical protein